MALIVAAWLVSPGRPGSIDIPLDVAGLALALAGVALVTWARRALGSAFTAFPEPRRGAALVAGGPYRLARHPIYGGALLLLGGISLARSAAGLVLTLALGVLWWRKSIAEEARLEAAYADYAVYRRQTPKRFLPFLL